MFAEVHALRMAAVLFPRHGEFFLKPCCVHQSTCSTVCNTCCIVVVSVCWCSSRKGNSVGKLGIAQQSDVQIKQLQIKKLCNPGGADTWFSDWKLKIGYPMLQTNFSHSPIDLFSSSVGKVNVRDGYWAACMSCGLWDSRCSSCYRFSLAAVVCYIVNTSPSKSAGDKVPGRLDDQVHTVTLRSIHAVMTYICTA